MKFRHSHLCLLVIAELALFIVNGRSETGTISPVSLPRNSFFLDEISGRNPMAFNDKDSTFFKENVSVTPSDDQCQTDVCPTTAVHDLNNFLAEEKKPFVVEEKSTNENRKVLTSEQKIEAFDLTAIQQITFIISILIYMRTLFSCMGEPGAFYSHIYGIFMTLIVFILMKANVISLQSLNSPWLGHACSVSPVGESEVFSIFSLLFYTSSHFTVALLFSISIDFVTLYLIYGVGFIYSFFFNLLKNVINLIRGFFYPGNRRRNVQKTKFWKSVYEQAADIYNIMQFEKSPVVVIITWIFSYLIVAIVPFYFDLHFLNCIYVFFFWLCGNIW